MKAAVVCYKIETPEEEELFTKILSYIKTKEIDFESGDVGVTKIEEEIDFCLSFGSRTKMYLPKYKRILIAPTLKEMIINPDLKVKAFEIINQFVEEVKTDVTDKVVIEKEEVTFGNKNADIIITEEEIKHLLKLKELLGTYDKIIITKGETQVVLEGPNGNEE